MEQQNKETRGTNEYVWVNHGRLLCNITSCRLCKNNFLNVGGAFSTHVLLAFSCRSYWFYCLFINGSDTVSALQRLDHYIHPNLLRNPGHRDLCWRLYKRFAIPCISQERHYDEDFPFLHRTIDMR